MPYRAILVCADDSAHAARRFHVAAWLAQAHHAHLTGLASTGVEQFLADALVSTATLASATPYVETMRQRARGALEALNSVACAMALTDVDTRQTDADVRTVLSALAAYHDLCIAGYCGSRGSGDEENWHWMADLTAASACPVLLLPAASNAAPPFDRILVAWNGSAGAARALRASMPLLQQASAVDVALFNPPAATAIGVEPVVEIARTLRRYGVEAHIVQRNEVSDVGHALLELAAARGNNLIVMGCYGHSRLREKMLGGATRTVLTASSIPVIMAA